MTFRTDLKAKTRADHDRVDRIFSDIDIGCASGFAFFCRAHLSCFTAFSQRMTAAARGRMLLDGMIDGLERDLGVLGIVPAAAVTPLPGPIDPLAIDYLVAGSRMGSRVLRKRWLASTDPTVRAAGAYFGLEDDPAFWQDTCAALAEIDPNSQRAQIILRDVRTLFNLFAAVSIDTVAPEVAAQ